MATSSRASPKSSTETFGPIRAQGPSNCSTTVRSSIVSLRATPNAPAEIADATLAKRLRARRLPAAGMIPDHALAPSSPRARPCPSRRPTRDAVIAEYCNADPNCSSTSSNTVPVPYEHESTATSFVNDYVPMGWRHRRRVHVGDLRASEDGHLLGVIELKPRELDAADTRLLAGTRRTGDTAIMTEAATGGRRLRLFDPSRRSVRTAVDWSAIPGNCRVRPTVARKARVPRTTGSGRRALVHSCRPAWPRGIATHVAATDSTRSETAGMARTA